MSRRIPRVGIALVVLLVGGLAVAIHLTRKSEERQAYPVFQWFSTLGFPDVKGLPYVRVATGDSSDTGRQSFKIDYDYGFLLSSNANSFRVFTVGAEIETYSNSLPGTAERDRVGFEALDLRPWARLRAEQLSKDQSEELNSWLPEEAETFILAWACWRNGFGSESLDLFRLADHPPDFVDQRHRRVSFQRRAQEWLDDLKEKWQNRGAATEETLRLRVEKEIAQRLVQRARTSFEDLSVSRPELLRQFEDVLSRYPNMESDLREKARQTVKELKVMIQEDLAHASQGTQELGQMPKEQQVGELIFQLRDQNELGGYGNWEFNQWETNTPAGRLVALGYAAVPQLIVALDSQTLSRMVGSSSGGLVLTVGECALQILERISGRSFVMPVFNSTNQNPGVRVAKAWWTEFQPKGERQMLLEGVARGDNDAPIQAEMLRVRYPDLAVQAIIRAIQATMNSGIRCYLIEELGKIDAVEVSAFLREEMLNGPIIQSRLESARLLRREDRTAAIEAMIHEWEKKSSDGADDFNDGVLLSGFLADCNSPQAIHALARDLLQRPVGQRYYVILDVGNTNVWGEDPVPSPQTLEAMEQCLASALEDTEEEFGVSGNLNEIDYANPRICDLAGMSLAARWPGRYSFDIEKSLQKRERQRIECLNVWRRNHGQASLPLPALPAKHVSRREYARITAVDWDAHGSKPGPDLAARVGRLKGKRLTARDLVGLLTFVARHPEPKASGLELRAMKDDDLTGVQLLVKLLPGPPPTPGTSWSINAEVSLGEEGLLHSSGAMNCTDPGDWEDFAEAAWKAIAGPPDTPFEIVVRFKPDNFTHGV